MTLRTHLTNAIGLAAIVGLTAAVYVMPAKAETFDCASLGDMAESIMTHRQNNVALSVVMNAAEDTGEQLMAEGTPAEQVDAIVNLYKSLSLAAYQMGHYSSPEFRERAIRNFRNQVETECYTAIE